MAIQIFSVFFLLLVLINNAAGSLHLDVNPYNISPGLTQSVTINCTFTYAQVSNITGLISLILSKMDEAENFQDLISINAFSPDQINVLSQVNGSMLGHINSNSESFLTIQWTYPSADKAGMYRCKAHGMDNAGYASELTQTVMVTSEQPDINQLIDKVSDLQRQLESQENIISHQSDLINTLLSLTQNQSYKINMLQAQQDYVFRYAVLDFHISTVYNNHIYLLSRSDWKDSTVAEQTCKDYKGYLAEIDYSIEDTFVNEFLNNLTGVDHVLISGTDEGHEGVWTYTGSSRNMTYINWYSGEPNSPDYNCMRKLRGYHWQVTDYPCTHTSNTLKFLCEVNLL